MSNIFFLVELSDSQLVLNETQSRQLQVVVLPLEIEILESGIQETGEEVESLKLENSTIVIISAWSLQE